MTEPSAEQPFVDRVALVTGGSRGIGRAVAVQFAAAGASVAVHYRADRVAADETVALLAPGPRHAAFQADISQAAEVSRLVDEVIAHFGRIDVLVNNAGIYEEHRVLATTYDGWTAAWDRTISTNLLGPANLIHRVVPHMAEGGGGRIVNVSSRGAFRGEPDFPAYGASKAALNSMGQSMAQALAPSGIYVTTVAPGFVETDMAGPFLDGPGGEAIRAQSPLRRAATPEEVARVVVFLATPGTEYATGTIVDVNGASYLRT